MPDEVADGFVETEDCDDGDQPDDGRLPGCVEVDMLVAPDPGLVTGLEVCVPTGVLTFLAVHFHSQLQTRVTSLREDRSHHLRPELVDQAELENRNPHGEHQSQSNLYNSYYRTEHTRGLS